MTELIIQDHPYALAWHKGTTLFAFSSEKEEMMFFENYSLQSRVGTNAAPLLHHLSSWDLKPLPSHGQGPWLSLV